MPIPAPTLIRYLRNILKSQYRITKTKQLMKRDVSMIIRKINILYTDVMPYVDDSKHGIKSHRETSCNVCYEEFNHYHTKQIILRTCGHQHICINCFQQYITIKVTENENLYIRCPHEGCKHAVDTHDVLLAFPALSKYMEQHQSKTIHTSQSESESESSRQTSFRSTTPAAASTSSVSSHKPTKRSRKKSRSGKITRPRSRSRTTDEDVKRPRTVSSDDMQDEIKSKCDADHDEKLDVKMEERLDPTVATQQLLLLYQLAATIASKLLARHRDWIPCIADTCLFGFYFHASDKDGVRTCGVCQLQQQVKRVVMQVDDDFQQLIDTGVVRGCPICNEYQMKDRGMCNVMECGRCGIFWNWETRTTARTSYELKEIARSEGSLWQPGELQYQQQLQRNNIEAFKQLLARNGIAYDPNYVRGS